MDCFVAEFIIGPAEGGTRWLLAMTSASDGWSEAIPITFQNGADGFRARNRKVYAAGE
jgi:hypothetical protein